MKTVVQDNLNPIDRIENATLIVASTIHTVSVTGMIKDSQLPRIQNSYPGILKAT